MTKPNLKNSFSVEDIHKLREYHYETTKKFSEKEFIDDINKKAEKFKKELNKNAQQGQPFSCKLTSGQNS